VAFDYVAEGFKYTINYMDWTLISVSGEENILLCK